MTGRVSMSEAIDFFNLAFADSRIYLGVSGGGETQERFDRLVEAAWDLGCIGVSSAEFDNTVNDHGFDVTTAHGFNIAYIVRSMYERSIALHGKNDHGGAEAIS